MKSARGGVLMGARIAAMAGTSGGKARAPQGAKECGAEVRNAGNGEAWVWKLGIILGDQKRRPLLSLMKFAVFC